MPTEETLLPGDADADNLSGQAKGFTPEQMVRCEQCLRANPPTRANCLYCAATLPVTEESAALRRPTLRPLEEWEHGFNCILRQKPETPPGAQALAAAADLLRLSVAEVSRLVSAPEPLPIACASSGQEASLIEHRLTELGLAVFTVSDDELALDAQPPKRIGSLELTAEALILKPAGGGQTSSASWESLELFVAGRLITHQVEVEERRGRRHEKEIMEARELSADESVLDIYQSGAAGNWRIAATNFDFSCLGPEKSLLVAENFKRLTEQLRNRASRAVYDDSYARLRQLLTIAWPPRQQTESRGWRRGGPGRYSTELVTTSDNESQFTRYSRLRRHLKGHGPERKS